MPSKTNVFFPVGTVPSINSSELKVSSLPNVILCIKTEDIFEFHFYINGISAQLLPVRVDLTSATTAAAMTVSAPVLGNPSRLERAKLGRVITFPTLSPLVLAALPPLLTVPPLPALVTAPRTLQPRTDIALPGQPPLPGQALINPSRRERLGRIITFPALPTVAPSTSSVSTMTTPTIDSVELGVPEHI